VISKSDLFILVVASAALGVGIMRWHQNTQNVNAITIPASTRIVTEELTPIPVPVITDNTTTVASNNTGAILAPENQPVTVQTLNQPIVQEIQAEPSTQNSAAGMGIHRVEYGDYLGKIAVRYDTDIQTLRTINGIDGSTILVGQEILYPL